MYFCFNKVHEPLGRKCERRQKKNVLTNACLLAEMENSSSRRHPVNKLLTPSTPIYADDMSKTRNVAACRFTRWSTSPSNAKCAPGCIIHPLPSSSSNFRDSIGEEDIIFRIHLHKLPTSSRVCGTAYSAVNERRVLNAGGRLGVLNCYFRILSMTSRKKGSCR